VDGRPPHVPALDGLRGLAVAGVLLFHAGHLVGGYLGVDLFFVLSGFLITSLLLDEWRRTDQIKLLAFWARRARRLLPALFAMLIGVAVYAVVLAKPAELDQIRNDAWATLAYVANWRAIFAGHSYWAQFSSPSPLEHTWSLAIEEQFYLVWPLMVVGVLTWRRGSARALLAVAALLAGASVLFMAVRYTPHTDPSRVYLGTDARASSVLLGAALACLLAWRGAVRSPRLSGALEVGGWIGAAGLAWAWTHLGGESPALYRGGMFLCGLAVLGVIAAVTRPRPGRLAATLSFRPLCALGIISYGVYLWHWPIYVVLSPQRTGLGDVALTLLRIVVTLAVATASFFVVEQPVRKGRVRQWPVLGWAPAAALAAAVAILSATVGAAPAVEAAATKPDPIPTRPAPAGVTKLMVVGDSVAYAIADGLKAHGDPWKVEVFNRAQLACEFTETADVTRNLSGQLVRVKPCWPPWAADVAAFHPDHVLLTFNGDFVRVPDGPCTPVYDAAYRARLGDAIHTLSSTGAAVAVATAAYPMLYTTVPFSLIEARVDCVNAATRAVAGAAGAQVIDLNGYVCPARRCLNRLDGADLRPDGLHYARSAGLSVGHWILAQMLGPPPP